MTIFLYVSTWFMAGIESTLSDYESVDLTLSISLQISLKLAKLASLIM